MSFGAQTARKSPLGGLAFLLCVLGTGGPLKDIGGHAFIFQWRVAPDRPEGLWQKPALKPGVLLTAG